MQSHTPYTNPGNRYGSRLIESNIGLVHAVKESPDPSDSTQNYITETPIIFIHGNYFSLPIWDKWVQFFKRRYHCIRIDLPGFGLSPPPKTGHYTEATDQTALKAVMDGYNIQSAHLVGTVLGGKVAYQYAAYHADRVQSLTLINSAGLPHHMDSPLTPSPVDEKVKNILLTAPESFLNYLLTNLTGPKGRIDPTLAQELVKISSRSASVKEIIKRMDHYIVGHAAEILPNIICPVLLMHGAHNPQFKPDDLNHLQHMLSGAKTIESHRYDGYGQLLPFEGCFQAIKDFDSFLQKLARQR